ncbi:VOC family protein [Fructilactobacillus sanfranciscensis]|uniref:VOC family protein n=1 Tax=Fructilactobacillus sanfranciscensis TaxID=1625 RepID=UPI00111B6A99|nr:VOC family protein [Fructilactobacillus sanfranciscensis]TNK96961.1 VOC family protein [Fructilactobacillus sanfranciscensis]
MNFKQIYHIAIIGSDYAESLHFYRDVLGFEVIREHQRPDKDDVKIDLKINETTELELFIKPDVPRRVNCPEAQGVEVEALRTDDYTGEKMVFFYGPDGLPIELHE